MADLVPRQFGELISPEDRSLKVLRVSRENNKGTDGDFRRLLAAAVQMFGAADILSKVQAGIEYVVQVPAEFRADLASGALEMLHGEESGKTWATIVRKLANGKNEIVANCPIAEELRVKGNPVQDMTGVYQNLYMQQKLNELSEQIKEVYDVVKRIEQGQTDDRIGILMSGRDDMLIALQNPDKFERTQEIIEARSKISEAQHRIGQVLKSRIEDFKPVHRNPAIHVLREFASLRTNYMSKRDEEFQQLQDYFELYLRATEYLASSFLVVEDTARAETVYQQARSFLQSIDYKHLQTLDSIYPKGSMADAFYHQSEQYIEDEKQLCLEEAKPYDFVQIEIPGEYLKEVVANG